MKPKQNTIEDPIIFYDGVCVFCNNSVNFILKRDKMKMFLFAPLQGDFAVEFLKNKNLPNPLPDSIILFDPDKNKFHFESTAALNIAGSLSGLWKVLIVFLIVPKPIRDFFYRIIARNRYKWFGKHDSCLVPNKEVKERFLL